MDVAMTSSSSDSDIEVQYMNGRIGAGVGSYQFPNPSPAKSSNRKSPVKMTSDESSALSDFSDSSEFKEQDGWEKNYLDLDSTSTSKNEKKTKALNNQVIKRLKNPRGGAKKARMGSRTPDFDLDPEESFKLSPELKVGDFLSGDYTREMQLKNGLLRDMSTLWKSKQMCDITIECDDGSLQAHKLILSARSDVFRAMFESGMSEASSNIVKIDDIKCQTMNILIQFMYTGRVGPLTVGGMTDLIVAADKYQMNKLKESCFHELTRKMNSRNVGEVMLLASSHNCSSDIKLYIQKFLLRERQGLWKVPEFQELAKANPMVITTFLFEDYSPSATFAEALEDNLKAH